MSPTSSNRKLAAQIRIRNALRTRLYARLFKKIELDYLNDDKKSNFQDELFLAREGLERLVKRIKTVPKRSLPMSDKFTPASTHRKPAG